MALQKATMIVSAALNLKILDCGQKWATFVSFSR